MLSDYSQSIYKNINIVFIYISEAHATDVWPIGLSAGVLNKKHRTLDDRIRCAKDMIHEHHFKVPVYVDNMKNGYRDSYSAWPFRIYGFKMNKIEYISDIKDAQFDISELFDYLKKL